MACGVSGLCSGTPLYFGGVSWSKIPAAQAGHLLAAFWRSEKEPCFPMRPLATLRSTPYSLNSILCTLISGAGVVDFDGID